MYLGFFKKTFGGLFVLVFLLTGLLVATSLINKKQDIRSKAAGASVVLSLSPQTTTPTVGTPFTVSILAGSADNYDISAVQVALTFSSNLTLTHVDKGTFFSQPAGYEMLNLGISCTADSDCRSAAQFALGDDIKCVTNICRNVTTNVPPANTIMLGAACPVSGQPPCLTNKTGVLAILTFNPTSAGAATVDFDINNTQVAVVGQIADMTNKSATTTLSLTVGGGASTTSTLTLKLKLPEFSSTSSTPSQLTPKVVRVTLKNGTTEVLKQDVTMVADTTNFGVYSGTLSNIIPGTYDLYLKPWAHLQKNVGPATFTSGTPLTKDYSPNTTFVAGDVAGSTISTNLGKPDNLTDTSDWQKILANMSFNQVAVTDPKVVLDLNSDTYIDTTDLQIVFKNMSLSYGDGGGE